MRRALGHRPMNRILLAVAVAMCWSAGAAFAQSEPDELRAYLTGNGLLNRGLYEQARVARYGLSVCLYRLGRLDEALVELDTIQDEQSFRFAPEVALLRGHSLLAQGDYESAGTAFEALIAFYPDHPNADDAAATLVESRYRQEGFDRAVEAAAVLAERWPKSPYRERAELFAGLSEMSQEQYAPAADRFEAMLSNYPDGQFAEHAALLLAQCQHRSGSIQRALRQYQAVIEQNVERFVPGALLGQAQILHRQGRVDEAGETLDRLLARYPESASIAAASLRRGRVWFDQGDFERALEALASFRAVAPENLADDAAYWSAKSMLRLGQYDEAAEALRKAIRQYPRSELMPLMLYDRAVSLHRAGDADEAAKVLETFASKYPLHEQAGAALYLRALIAHQGGDYDPARELCQRFAGEYPSHALAPAVAFLAAENEYLAGEYGAAEAAYRAFIAQHADDDQIDRARYRLGMSLYRLDRFDEAEALLADAVSGQDTDPEFRPALLALGDGVFARGDWSAAQWWLASYLRFGTGQSGADDARLKLGLAMQRQGQHTEAIAGFQRLLDEHPQSPHNLQALFEMGQSYAALGRTDHAETAFTRVLDESDDSRFAAHALNHLAAIAMQRRDYALAEELYGRVEEAAFDDDIIAEAVFQRAQAMMSSERLDDAIALYSKVVDDYAGHGRAPTARARRAVALARVGRIENALEELVQVESAALVSAALMDTVAYEKAWCLKQLGRTEEASSAYAALLDRDLDPSIRAYGLLDQAAIEMGTEDYSRAAAHLHEVRALVDDTAVTLPEEIDEQSLYRLGVCAYRSGAYEQAAAYLDQFVRGFEHSDLLASASLICGESNFKVGRYSRAATHLQRVVDNFENDPTYPASLLRLGESHVALQHWEKSRELFGRYLERFGDSELWFQARFGLGYAIENLGRHDEAIAVYREVVNRHKGSTAARAQFQIGECLFATKRYDEAATALLRVDILYAYPEWSAAALYEAGRCFEAMGRMGEARNQFQQVVERFEDSEWAHLASQRLEAATNRTRPGRP
ncbi:MAG: tetratricopeptide repeat protein [Planctomycetes bacterium]|nr:tetratricopeptide repeat protein [Planctomycetota bacterium]